MAPMALKAFQRSGQVEMIRKKKVELIKNHPGFLLEGKSVQNLVCLFLLEEM